MENSKFDLTKYVFDTLYEVYELETEAEKKAQIKTFIACLLKSIELGKKIAFSRDKSSQIINITGVGKIVFDNNKKVKQILFYVR